MSVRPIIGVPTQTLEPIPGQTPYTWIMGQKYIQVLTREGGVPWPIPLLPDDEATLRCIYDRLDAVFLTGGVDVDPANYDEPKEPVCGRTDPPRDWTEITLVRWAIADHKPVLGVCRGVQLINVVCGGSLYQDVTTQVPQAIKHDYFPDPAKNYTRDMLIHDIDIARDTRLGRILDAARLPVNSMHHQGIKRIAPNLVPNAWSTDGLIEGVEGRNGHYLIGVQWHPEELTEKQASMRALFQSFAQAAIEFHHHRSGVPV